MSKKATGKYVYDEKLGKVVRVSERVPGLSKGPRPTKAAPCPPAGCGRCH